MSVEQKMRQVMSGGTQRYVLDEKSLERSLGASPGPLLIELARLACRLDPFTPSAAFMPLGMHLAFMTDTKAELEDAYPWNPKGVLPFADRDIDSMYAGFVDDERSLPLDQRPICLVGGGDARAVAPDLASFLSLVAFAGMTAIGESDDFWAELRSESLREESFDALSNTLCSLPGVHIPKRPSVIVRACRDIVVELTEPDPTRAKPPGYERIRELIEKRAHKMAQAELIEWIELCVSLGERVHPDRWRQIRELLVELDPPLSDELRAALGRRLFS